MVDEQDHLIGRQGVWKELSNDSLFDSKAKHVDYEAAFSNQRIHKAIQVFLDMTPLDFDDHTFLVATDHLTDLEFVKAMFLVYLKRKNYDPHADSHIASRQHRFYRLQQCRASTEFQNRWTKQITVRLKKNPLRYLLNKLLSQATK